MNFKIDCKICKNVSWNPSQIVCCVPGWREQKKITLYFIYIAFSYIISYFWDGRVFQPTIYQRFKKKEKLENRKNDLNHDFYSILTEINVLVFLTKVKIVKTRNFKRKSIILKHGLFMIFIIIIYTQHNIRHINTKLDIIVAYKKKKNLLQQVNKIK